MDIPVRAILTWLDRRKVALAIGFGITLRLADYLRGRPYWMDEKSLIDNIQKLSPIGFFRPLRHIQLAPPGFLLAVWSTVQMFGDNVYAMRSIPLAGGIASMFLFTAVARRLLPPLAMFPAVLMFAVAGDPVYYASETKQYSTDIASGLAWLLAALVIGPKALTAARVTRLALAGAAIVWFSHSSVFVLASVGLVGLAGAIGARDRRRAVAWSVIGAAWVSSIAGVHAVSRMQLGSDRAAMWHFWDFAFPPMPPGSVWDATWPLRRLAFYFVNPLDFNAPFGANVSMLPALSLATIGVVRLWKVDRSRCALLLLPIAMTLVAASFKLYPFHGRLILFLCPIFLIAIAAGLDVVREARGRRVIYWGLAAMVLVVPAVAALDRATNPNLYHGRFGDLRTDDVDPYRFPF